MKFSSRMNVAASTDSLVHEPLRKKAKVEPKDLLMELQQPVVLYLLPRVLRCRACRRVTTMTSVVFSFNDDVEDKKEDDSADAFVSTHVLAQEINFSQAEQEVDQTIDIFMNEDIEVIIGAL